MGQVEAMKEGDADRYFQDADATPTNNWCLRASRHACHYLRTARDYVYQMMGGVKSGMGYCGAHTLRDLQGQRQLHSRDRRRHPRKPPARREPIHPGSAKLTPWEE